MRDVMHAVTLAAVLAAFLIPSVFAAVDVYQGAHSATASTAIDPGPKGIGGLVTQINSTVGTGIKVDVSGTWLQDSDRIIVDALLIDNDGEPIAGQNCTLSLKDSNFDELLTNAQMAENAIAGQSHYTYNATNISAIASGIATGKFFGHVQCIKGPPAPAVIFAEADFEVHRIVGSLIDEVRDARSRLEALLDRQFEFSQEEIFLVTDAFNSMGDLLEAVEQGKLAGPAARAQMTELEQRVEQKLGKKTLEATIAPKASAGGAILSSIKAIPKKTTTAIKESSIVLWLIVALLIIANVVALHHRYRHKPRDEFGEDFGNEVF